MSSWFGRRYGPRPQFSLLFVALAITWLCVVFGGVTLAWRSITSAAGVRTHADSAAPLVVLVGLCGATVVAFGLGGLAVLERLAVAWRARGWPTVRAVVTRNDRLATPLERRGRLRPGTTYVEYAFTCDAGEMVGEAWIAWDSENPIEQAAIDCEFAPGSRTTVVFDPRDPRRSYATRNLRLAPLVATLCALTAAIVFAAWFGKLALVVFD